MVENVHEEFEWWFFWKFSVHANHHHSLPMRVFPISNWIYFRKSTSSRAHQGLCWQYCMPADGVELTPAPQLLTPEEVCSISYINVISAGFGQHGIVFDVGEKEVFFNRLGWSQSLLGVGLNWQPKRSWPPFTFSQENIQAAYFLLPFGIYKGIANLCWKADVAPLSAKGWFQAQTSSFASGQLSLWRGTVSMVLNEEYHNNENCHFWYGFFGRQRWH